MSPVSLPKHAKLQWCVRYSISLFQPCSQPLAISPKIKIHFSFLPIWLQEVVGHSEEVQIHAREFGQNLAFAQQIKSEIDQFSDDDQRDSFKLLSAPVVLHVRQQRESSSFIEEASLLPVVTSTADDRTAMFEAVRSGPGIELAKELGHHHRREALAKLEHLPDTESKAALTNIVNSIACVG